MGAGTLRIGTRGSALATAQSQLVADRISAATDRPTELVLVKTEGDVNRAPLTSFGGQGVFTSALREALLDEVIDVAVHSLKDLPTKPDPRTTLAAIPERADARDVLVARDGLTLGELPPGSVIGTGSPRRAAQLNALGLGVTVTGIRGNVDTRIAKVRDGEVDAVILARAGLARLGRLGDVTETLDPLQMLPAPGQGALACECRAEDDATTALLQKYLDDGPTRAAVTAERSVLATLEAGCSAPVGALADVALGDDGDELWLRAIVGAVSGVPTIRMSMTGSPGDAAGVGERLAAEMLAEGAASLFEGVAL